MTSEGDDVSFPSGFKAAWHCTVLKALWRDAKTERDEWRLEEGVGIYGNGL